MTIYKRKSDGWETIPAVTYPDAEPLLKTVQRLSSEHTSHFYLVFSKEEEKVLLDHIRRMTVSLCGEINEEQERLILQAILCRDEAGSGIYVEQVSDDNEETDPTKIFLAISINDFSGH